MSGPQARYWAGRVEERSLVPVGEARLGRIALDERLGRSESGALIPPSANRRMGQHETSPLLAALRRAGGKGRT